MYQEKSWMIKSIYSILFLVLAILLLTNPSLETRITNKIIFLLFCSLLPWLIGGMIPSKANKKEKPKEEHIRLIEKVKERSDRNDAVSSLEIDKIGNHYMKCVVLYALLNDTLKKRSATLESGSTPHERLIFLYHKEQITKTLYTRLDTLFTILDQIIHTNTGYIKTSELVWTIRTGKEVLQSLEQLTST